jgi:DNA helicase-2/ATP-dependent DNA helicase PcrA
VDEMQDYSMIQYLIIQRLFKCKMTILGDREQTMDGDQQDVLTFLPKIFGKDIRRIVMNKSYRNTIEIASYANKLAGITEVELFERHGKPVEEKEFTGLTEALERVVKELRLEKQTVEEADEDMPENAASETDGTENGEELSYETAAVITRTADEAREAYYILQKKLEAEGFDTKERLSAQISKRVLLLPRFIWQRDWNLIRYFLYFRGLTEVRSCREQGILRQPERFMNCICMK